MLACLLFFKVYLFIVREIKQGQEWERGRERGRKRMPSRLCAVSTEPGVELGFINVEIMT